MGTMTINVSDAVEHKFRDLIREQFGTRKGTMGKAVEEALAAYVEEKKQGELRSEAIKLLRKGFDLGGLKIKSRDELHERLCLAD